MAREFDRSAGAMHSVSAIEARPISFPGWRPQRAFRFSEVDWVGFLHGCGMDERLLAFSILDLSDMNPPNGLAGLVQAVGIFYRTSVAVQSLPLQSEIVGHLRKMRAHATALAHLAQGGDGKGEAIDAPNWSRDYPGLDLESDGSLNPSKRRATSALHPVIHELLVQAREDLSGKPIGTAQDNARIWRDIAVFTEIFRRIPRALDKAVELARNADHGDTASPHRSADNARQWARSRLLWIWRDVIGKEIRLNLKSPSDHLEVEDPEPNDCLRFIIEALQHIDPVMPHAYPALATDLRRLRSLVPLDRLLNPVK